MKLKTLALIGSAFALSLSTVACKQSPSADAPPAAVDSADWIKFVDGFLEGYFKLDPSHAIYQGRHEFDGQLPDWSKEGLAKMADYLKKAKADAEGFDPGKLSKAQQIERKYLIKVVETELFWRTDADNPRTNITWYFDAGLDPNVYIARPYADPATRLMAFIAYAKNVPKAVEQSKANLKTPMPISHVDYAIPGANGLADYYVNDAKLAFAGVKDAKLQAEFKVAAGEARTAMLGLATWLEGQRKTANQDYQLGADKFARMLMATEGVDTPVAEIRKIGYADLLVNQNALKEACAKFAVGDTMQACMAKMNASKPRGGPVVEARNQLPELRKFLDANSIVTIPGTENALVEESPPYNRQNSAYIDIPGPYEKGLPSVYYIAPPDPAWTAEEQLGFIPGRKDLLFTSVHEVWPGHFLQFLHANRAKSVFGRVFYSYAFSEGWAHYSEEMMYDAGLNKQEPETRIGQISNALLRNCRLISAIDLHTGKMTQEQSRQLFMDECYQDEGNAKQQSARGTYDPAYLNYTMGKLLIRKLREDWTKGDRSKWKAFHDEFLSYGSPPIPLVRAAMTRGEAKAVF
jgi:uncharacterized protein (DUF885 family)